MKTPVKLESPGLAEESANEFADVTIDSVLQELTVWRKTKADHKQSGYPDPLWRRILWLGQQHGETKIRTLFAIGSGSYKVKALQFAQRAKSHEKPADNNDKSSVPFVEMTVTTPETPPTVSVQAATASTQSIYQPEDVTLPDTHTVSVVEVCRPDGMVMKIHTVNNHWLALIKAFLAAHLS